LAWSRTRSQPPIHASQLQARRAAKRRSIWITWDCQSQIGVEARIMAARSPMSAWRNRAAQRRNPKRKATDAATEGSRRAQGAMP